jgi:hypothetical protein
MSMRYIFALLILYVSPVSANSGELDGPTILARATDAAGGRSMGQCEKPDIAGARGILGT